MLNILSNNMRIENKVFNIKEFMENKTIQKIEIRPRYVNIYFTDKTKVKINSFAVGWDISSYGLNFELEDNNFDNN